MRARSAVADLPQAGTRRDRLARALSEDWQTSRELLSQSGLAKDTTVLVLHEFANLQLAEMREVNVGQTIGWGYEWRRGVLWESAYGGEG